MKPSHVRPGVPWIDPPDPCFAAHMWSELIASGVKFSQVDRKIVAEIPGSRTDRNEIVRVLRNIGFNGLKTYSSAMSENGQLLVVTVVVDP